MAGLWIWPFRGREPPHPERVRNRMANRTRHGSCTAILIYPPNSFGPSAEKSALPSMQRIAAALVWISRGIWILFLMLSPVDPHPVRHSLHRSSRLSI